MSVGGGVNNAIVSIQTTEANLAGALRLAAEILREPSFPDTEFEQVRQQQRSPASKKARAIRRRWRSGAAAAPEPLPARRCALRRHARRADRRPEEGHAGRGAQVLPAVLRRFGWRIRGQSASSIRPQVQKLAAELFGNWKSPGPLRAGAAPVPQGGAEIRRSKLPTSRTPVRWPAERQDDRRGSRLSGHDDGEYILGGSAARGCSSASATRKA